MRCVRTEKEKCDELQVVAAGKWKEGERGKSKREEKRRNVEGKK